MVHFCLVIYLALVLTPERVKAMAIVVNRCLCCPYHVISEDLGAKYKEPFTH